MSTFVLNRNYALQMPSSYVDIDREEMEYVDGGGYLKLVASESAIRDIATAGCSMVGALVGLAIGGWIGKTIGQSIGSIIGGAVGWMVGGIIARGNLHGNYTIYSGWCPFDLGKVYLP